MYKYCHSHKKYKYHHVFICNVGILKINFRAFPTTLCFFWIMGCMIILNADLAIKKRVAAKYTHQECQFYQMKLHRGFVPSSLIFFFLSSVWHSAHSFKMLPNYSSLHPRISVTLDLLKVKLSQISLSL
jgi:hypothetical protein